MAAKPKQFVRSAIKKDLLCFALPALLVLVVGLVVCARDGYDGLVGAIFDLIQHPQKLHQLSLNHIVGLVLFLAGLTVALVAVGTLRRFYSSTLVIIQGHQLMSRGIYRFVRHPIYLGGLTICIGAVPVYASSLFGLLIMSALIPLVLNRIRMEEELLTDEFGDTYRSYKATTRKLIPFIY